MKTLVAGWFSFEQMGASAGDLVARDLVCDWLAAEKISFDVALAPPFAGGVNWRVVPPEAYSHVVFVCGPFGNGEPITEFLARFAGRRLIGLNLTMLDPLETFNPFDLLIERDSSRATNPDMVFGAGSPRVPVVGLVCIDKQPEYGKRDRHDQADQAIARLVASREMAIVRIDTRLDYDRNSLRSPGEIESLIARMDAVITTRLHGLVLSLKNGVPALVIDSVAGGAKVGQQARTLGWPITFDIDEVTDAQLQQALDVCLAPETRQRAEAVAGNARRLVDKMRQTFQTAWSDQQPMKGA